jgi:heme A synthase
VAAAAALLAWRRRRAGTIVSQLLALAQTLLVAQVGLGLLLLSDHKRAADRLHYAYGTFALLAVLSPWLYAPSDPRARLVWFAVATLVAAALAVRAYLTAT